MKRILISVFAFIGLTLHAQDFDVEVLDTTIYGIASEDTFYEDIDLYNNVGTPYSMNWERIEESIPEGWTSSNCDPDDCRPIGVTSASFTLPSTTGFLNTHFYPNGVAGSGYVKVKVWVSDNPSDSVVLTYYGVAGTVGIDDLDASDIQVFPSPTQNTLNVMLPNPGEIITVDLINLNGQQLDSFNISQDNLTSVDISNLESGVYILQFKLADKGIITKKFVKE